MNGGPYAYQRGITADFPTVTSDKARLDLTNNPNSVTVWDVALFNKVTSITEYGLTGGIGTNNLGLLVRTTG